MSRFNSQGTISDRPIMPFFICHKTTYHHINPSKFVGFIDVRRLKPFGFVLAAPPWLPTLKQDRSLRSSHRRSARVDKGTRFQSLHTCKQSYLYLPPSLAHWVSSQPSNQRVFLLLHECP